MSDGLNNKRKSNSDIVDCEKANKGVFLVKVPRYLNDIWEKNAGSDVGILKVIADSDEAQLISITPDEKTDNKPMVSQASAASSSTAQQSALNGRNNYRTVPNLNDLKPLGKDTSKEITIPKEHKFRFTRLDQSLGIFLEDKTALKEDANLKAGKVTLEGRVVKRAEIQPPATKEYMMMKRNMICKALQPTSVVKKVDKVVNTFKPRAAQQEALNRQKAKKDAGIKSIRGDQDVITEQLFKAFEKHQYYKLQDLAKITNQPPTYIREILTNIAVYNSGPPHKNTWELKPEYRS